MWAFAHFEGFCETLKIGACRVKSNAAGKRAHSNRVLLHPTVTFHAIEDGASALGRFELLSEIASGGMATVYLARSTGAHGFSRLFAIKRLHPHLAKDHDFVDMFLDEARLAARIHHPNVVAIQEVGESDQGYYLVMDYVEGATLAHLLARSSKIGKRAIPLQVSLRIVLDLLAGLTVAHDLEDDNGHPLEIVHRDVSPQNLLVGVDGITRLTDFGVAKAAARLTSTRSGQIKGKLSYMAPEQAKAGAVDRRADIFAAGVILWEALALRRLFKGEGDADVLNKILHLEIPKLPDSVPQELREICEQALERDPERRFPTAAAFAEALEFATKTSGGVGTARDVARALEETLGTDIAQKRDAVRVHMSRTDRRSGSHLDLLVPTSSSREAAADVTRREPSAPSAVRATPTSHSDMTRGAVVASKPPPAAPAGRKSRAALVLLSVVVIGLVAFIAIERWKVNAHPTAPDAVTVGAHATFTAFALTSGTPLAIPASAATDSGVRTSAPTQTPTRSPLTMPWPSSMHTAKVQSGTGSVPFAKPSTPSTAATEDFRNPYR